MSRAKPVDWIALYLLLFGVWPLADPEHGFDTLLSMLDIALHVAAAIVLISRWRLALVRRTDDPDHTSNQTHRRP